MKSLSRAEAGEWCESHGIPLDENSGPQPVFKEEQGFDFPIPVDAGARVFLANQLSKILPRQEEALLWITSWGIWPSGDRPHLFERFRLSYGETRPLKEIPAFLFAPSEREDLISFFTIALLFLYDCHLLPASGDSWIFVSHDEIGWACASKPECLAPLKNIAPA